MAILYTVLLTLEGTEASASLWVLYPSQGACHKAEKRSNCNLVSCPWYKQSWTTVELSLVRTAGRNDTEWNLNFYSFWVFLLFFFFKIHLFKMAALTWAFTERKEKKKNRLYEVLCRFQFLIAIRSKFKTITNNRAHIKFSNWKKNLFICNQSL